VSSVTDLAKSGVKLALCQPEVPCGAVAAEVFKNAKITVKPVTLEPDVKTTLSKVELNEVDAGVVYVTDVRAAGSKVKGIVIPDNLNASAEYLIAALANAPNATGAQAFVAYVLSPAGQSVLSADGFQKP
jgi:molybdate transport system substrate-binding protein